MPLDANGESGSKCIQNTFYDKGNFEVANVVFIYWSGGYLQLEDIWVKGVGGGYYYISQLEGTFGQGIQIFFTISTYSIPILIKFSF